MVIAFKLEIVSHRGNYHHIVYFESLYQREVFNKSAYIISSILKILVRLEGLLLKVTYHRSNYPRLCHYLHNISPNCFFYVID